MHTTLHCTGELTDKYGLRGFPAARSGHMTDAISLGGVCATGELLLVSTQFKDK